MDLKAYLSEKKVLVDSALDVYLPECVGPLAQLVKAMRYSLFAGGKRVRPILCVAGAEAVGGRAHDVLPVACALEMIHTYSLIHDDLPAMDDDDLRRGRPTNHKVFGEAMALLAGDGLLTEAFRLFSHPDLCGRVSHSVIVRTVGIIATAAGCQGMVGGQAVDMEVGGETEVDGPLLEFMHVHKTGALIEASVASGVLLGGGDERDVETFSLYGRKIGLAFQIADDILDVEGDSETMGKRAGSDVRMNKVTFPKVLGMTRSREMGARLVEEAIETLARYDAKAEPLRRIARYILERRN
jgi:geranylgeranyl diphosphate synthase, type II